MAWLAIVPAIALLVLMTIWGTPSAASSGRFVVVTDIHAFACADGGPCDAPPMICPGSTAERAISCTPSHIDTDGCLFDSFLEDVACEQQGHTDFVLIPGDWIAHRYGRSPGNVATKRDIVETTTNRIVAQLPGALVVPALGNNDAYLGDYNLAPCLAQDPTSCVGSEGQFLRDTLALWRPLLDRADEVGTACVANPDPSTDYLEHSFLRGGYYAISNPHLPNNCTFVLNTVLFLESYISGDDGVSAHGTEAAEKQLEWLRQRLEFARNHQRRVWMIYHVPPGANTYDSNQHQSAQMMFSTDPAHDYATIFVSLMAEYDDVIEASFGGHTHLDSFRVLRTGTGSSVGDAVSFVHVAPSLTPNHHKDHGAYQWFTFGVDQGATRIDNMMTRHLELQSGQSWRQEYAWSETFCQPCDYDAQSLGKVYGSLRDSNARSHAHDKHYYTKYFAEGDYSSISDPGTWPWYLCAIGNLSFDDYQACAQAVAAEP